MWVSIKLGDRTLFLWALYIPPDRKREVSLMESHCQSLFSILEIARHRDEVVVIGDSSGTTM